MGGWIKTAARMPEEYRQIILYVPAGDLNGVHTGQLETNWAGLEFWADEGMFTIEEVTHWMPLPEPPKDNE